MPVFVVMVVLVALAMAPFLLWGLINPRSMWWRLSARRYRNPSAHEPSAATYAAQRAASIVGFGVLLLGTASVLVVAGNVF